MTREPHTGTLGPVRRRSSFSTGARTGTLGRGRGQDPVEPEPPEAAEDFVAEDEPEEPEPVAEPAEDPEDALGEDSALDFLAEDASELPVDPPPDVAVESLRESVR